MIIFIYPIYGIKQIRIYGIQTNSIYGGGGLLRNEKGSVVMSFITYFGNMINRDKFSHCCYMNECRLLHGISVWQ